jgi:DNA-binding NarL/FixJ family response regulator
MSPEVRTHVAIVSDDRLLRDGLVQFLSHNPELTVTSCESHAGASLARIAAEHDVILVDARMEPTGVATVPSGGLILFVGAQEDEVWAAAALGAGARGILTRDASHDDVLNAIRVVLAGGIWARRRWLNACVLRGVGASRQQLPTRAAVDARLSRREREVLRHAATGVGNKELADRLSISEATVKVHLTHIFQKLGVPGRAALAAAYHGIGAAEGAPRAPGRTTNVLRP